MIDGGMNNSHGSVSNTYPNTSLQDTSRSILDILAPFLTGIGASLGWILLRTITTLIPNISHSQLLLLLIPILSYAFCTCTHRRNILFSKVALMSALGSIGGFILGGAIALAFVPTGIQAIVDIIIAIFLFIVPFFICRYLCNIERRKNNRSIHRM